MRRLYLDNPVLRDVTGSSAILRNCYDDFIQIFGRRFKGVKSYYLFFEFYGVAKDWFAIPPEMREWDFSEVQGSPSSAANITIIDRLCTEGVQRLDAHVHEKLHASQDLLKEVIARRLGEITLEGAEIEKVLFEDIRRLVDEDFDAFIREAKRYLVWDAFCGISSKGIGIEWIRQRQLGNWYQTWQKGILLPLGKIIDDHAKYYDMTFKSRFKNYEDMVDAEMATYLAFGCPMDGELERCDCLSYEDSASISERGRLFLGTISNLKGSLKQDVRYKSGKAYCIVKTNGQICKDGKVCFADVHELMIPIELGFIAKNSPETN